VPTGITFAPDGQHAYVANQLSNNVGVILAGSAQQIATIPTGDASPFVVQVSVDNTRLYIGTNIGRILVVDAQSYAVLATIELGNAINGFAVHPDGRMIYASSFTGGTVYEVDAVTSSVLRTFSVGGSPQDLALDHRGTTLYVSNEGGYISPVDLSTGAIATPIPLAGGGFGVGVTPDDKQAWVSLPGLGQVQVFDLKKGTVLGVLDVGGEPRRISFSDQGKIGAVANMGGFVTLVR
jgi:YVTN family beta-propeller protein